MSNLFFADWRFVVFRELPGFGSTRLLLSSIAEDLDSWRTQAEEAVGKLFEVYVQVANDLAEHRVIHTYQVPG